MWLRVEPPTKHSQGQLAKLFWQRLLTSARLQHATISRLIETMSRLTGTMSRLAGRMGSLAVIGMMSRLAATMSRLARLAGT